MEPHRAGYSCQKPVGFPFGSDPPNLEQHRRSAWPLAQGMTTLIMPTLVILMMTIPAMNNTSTAGGARA